MKCPKCSYLGFETGDRCKNCGYDFSLIAAVTAADDSLPLFNPDDADDIPLVAVPVAPRPPLSVRRTPDTPRLRAVPRLPRRAEPALNFRDEPDEEEAPQATPAALQPEAPRMSAPAVDGKREIAGRRIVAAAIDHTILLSIDLAVVYFTLRIAGLDGPDVAALPAAPLVAFLALLKFSYFAAFTAVGGQTIGKMAVRIRVIGDHVSLDGGRAIRRTLAGIVALVPLGMGFLPALFGADRRALHDRLTHTRVIGLPSA